METRASKKSKLASLKPTQASNTPSQQDIEFTAKLAQLKKLQEKNNQIQRANIILTDKNELNRQAIQHFKMLNQYLVKKRQIAMLNHIVSERTGPEPQQGQRLNGQRQTEIQNLIQPQGQQSIPREQNNLQRPEISSNQVSNQEIYENEQENIQNQDETIPTRPIKSERKQIKTKNVQKSKIPEEKEETKPQEKEKTKPQEREETKPQEKEQTKPQEKEQTKPQEKASAGSDQSQEKWQKKENNYLNHPNFQDQTEWQA